MKKFRYRLEALLKVKEHLEKERQKEHGAALQKVLHQEQSLKQIGHQQQETLHRQRQGMTGELSVAELLVYARYILKLKRDTLAERELLHILKKDMEVKRNTLLEASKERKIYQKLKERQREQHDKVVHQHTTKENDEIALNSFRLKSD